MDSDFFLQKYVFKYSLLDLNFTLNSSCLNVVIITILLHLQVKETTITCFQRLNVCAEHSTSEHTTLTLVFFFAFCFSLSKIIDANDIYLHSAQLYIHGYNILFVIIEVLSFKEKCLI